MKNIFITTFILLSMAFLTCNQRTKNNVTLKNQVPIKEDTTLRIEDRASLTNNNQRDSLLLEKYEYEIKKELVNESELLTKTQLDSLFDENRFIITDSKVVYSPDSTFKIFTLIVESCGAYCNPNYYSWIHFNLKQREKVKKVEFSEIDSIYRIEKNRFLIIDRSWGRPASVMTVECMSANLVSFSKSAIKIEPIKTSTNKNFSFCQQNYVEMEGGPYIKYDENKKTLHYYFGNNEYYSTGIDVDTIRKGQMKYLKGSFILMKETITLNDKR